VIAVDGGGVADWTTRRPCSVVMRKRSRSPSAATTLAPLNSVRWCSSSYSTSAPMVRAWASSELSAWASSSPRANT
jgi:hypothetical protein